MNDENEHELRLLIAQAFTDEDGDDPRDSVKVDFSRLEILLVMLGLYHLLGDENMPNALKRKCVVLFDRTGNCIEDQKE